MPRLMCGDCGFEMRCIKNEVPVVTHSSGTEQQELFSGDLYKCPDCEFEVITGFSACIVTSDDPRWPAGVDLKNVTEFFYDEEAADAF